MGSKLKGLPFEHCEEITLQQDESLLTIILSILSKGYYIMLSENNGVITLMIDTKRFTQR